MNIKLFIRKTKGVILTNEGKELYRLIANNIDNIMKSEISFSKIIKNKAIKIAGNKTYINYLIENKKLDSIFNTNSNINLIDTNSFDLLKAAYHLGNRHVPLMLTPTALYFEPDHVLAEMIIGLGLTVNEVEHPFEPESGAYAQHQHDHRLSPIKALHHVHT